MSRLQAYPAYEVTGVDWFPSLPVGWSSTKLKYVATCLSGGTPDTAVDDYWLMDDTGIPWVSISDMSGRQIVSSTSKSLSDEALASKSLPIGEPGMLLFAMYASVGEVTPLGIAAAWNQALLGIKARPVADTRFIYYALKSVREWLPALYRSNTQNNLNAEQVGNFDIPFPPLASQKAIAKYLDRETVQIDDLIIKQERLIDLLTEKRQATITHAVTKGLDPIAPTKPSGVPWLGDIPAAWSVSKLGWKSRGIGDGLHGTPTYSEHGSIPFVNGTNLLGGTIRITDSTNFVEQDQLSVADVGLDEFTVLISINGTIGNCAVLGDQQVMLSKSAAYIKCAEGMNVHFLAHYLRSDPTRSYFFASSGGTTIANLSLATLRKTPVPVPPIQIQEEITGWLNARLHSFDELGAKASEAVRLLRERRSALISAAVTGKIDVREGAA